MENLETITPTKINIYAAMNDFSMPLHHAKRLFFYNNVSTNICICASRVLQKNS